MKKLLAILLFLFTLSISKSQCDWSDTTFEKGYQNRNEFYFQTNMHPDSCGDYIFTVYDYQRQVEDTMEDRGGWFFVSLSNGKYQARMIAFNRCIDCDTVFTIDIDVTIFGTLGYRQTVDINDCKSITFNFFDLEDNNDSCYRYLYEIWKADKYINGLSEEEWKNVSDVDLRYGYNPAPDLLIHYGEYKDTSLKYTFKDTGRYLITLYVSNECTGIDTGAYVKLNVCGGQKTSSVKQLTKTDLTNGTVIGYYDMLGRRVDALEPNRIYIVIYSNGRRQKIMRTN